MGQSIYTMYLSANDQIHVPMFDPQLSLEWNPEAIRPSYIIKSRLEVQSVEQESIPGHKELRAGL